MVSILEGEPSIYRGRKDIWKRWLTLKREREKKKIFYITKAKLSKIQLQYPKGFKN